MDGTDVLLYHFLTPCITSLHKDPESKFSVDKSQAVAPSAASQSPSTVKWEIGKSAVGEEL